MDKNNENRNENLSFITDEDALTEIDFGSFLEETSKDAPLFEGFHEDIERTERSLESELQSLYDDIMNSGPATIVPKPMSVITAEPEPEEQEEIVTAESGLSEMWMNPEEYIDIPVVMLDETEESEDEQELVPEEAFFRPEPHTEEALAFAAEPIPEAEPELTPAFEPAVEPEANAVDSEKDDIFGLIDRMKSSADEETGFDDILAEIESNTGIAPVANNYDAIQDFLSSFPVEAPAEQPPVMQPAAPVYQAADTAESLPVTEQEDAMDTDSEEFERELAALLGEESSAEEEPAQDTTQMPVQDYAQAPVEETAQTADDDFVVNIPDDDFVVNIPDDEVGYIPAENGFGENKTPEEADVFLVFDDPETPEAPVIPDVPAADGESALPEASAMFGEPDAPVAFDATATPEEQRAAVFFDPNMVGGYSQLPEEQTERVVIGDFEAAKKAAIEASAVETKKEKKARKKQEKKDRKNGEKKPLSAGEVVRRIVLTLSFMVMIVCAGVLVNTYVVQPKIAEENISQQNSQLEAGEEKYGDVQVDDVIREEYDINFPEGMLAKYTRLYQENNDLHGWISIPAFEMNLPLVQGTDNNYYLKRNFYKKWVSYGVPFFDYRIEEEQFKNLPRNTVIYGHNMRSDDLIFGMLEEYRDIDGFKRAPIIECNTIYGDYKWVVCGVFISNSDPKHDNGYVFPYNFIDCSDQLFAEYIVELEKRSLYNTGVGLEITDKILTLSTCAYDFKDARLVVVARLLRPGESVNVDTSKAVVNSDPKGPQAWCDELNKPNNYADEKHWYID